MFVAGAFLMAIFAGAEAADPDGLSTKMAEVDGDKDGRPDVRTEIISRDGSVRPAEVKVVEMLRKQDALLSEFWSKAARDPETMKGAMMEAREKMKDIAEEAKKGD